MSHYSTLKLIFVYRTAAIIPLIFQEFIVVRQWYPKGRWDFSLSVTATRKIVLQLLREINSQIGLPISFEYLETAI